MLNELKEKENKGKIDSKFTKEDNKILNKITEN